MKELTPYQEECLTILMEECGEAIQEICKIYRFGLEEMSHHSPEKNHIACLTQELGDIICMIEMVRDSNIGITDEALVSAAQNKREKLGKWMKHKKPATVKPASIDEVMLKTSQLARQQLNNYKKVK